MSVRLLAQPLENGLEVVLRLDLELGRPHLLLLVEGEPEAADPGIRPLLDLRHVLLGHADLTPDRDQRQRHREGAHELAAPVVDEVVDQARDERLEEGVELLDAVRAEGVVEEAPELHVARLVVGVERRNGDPALLLVELLHALRGARRLGELAGLLVVLGLDGLDGVAGGVADAVREAFRVEERHAHVLVAREHVHPGGRVLPDRRVVPQLLVRVVRAVVDGRFEEVHLGRLRGHRVLPVEALSRRAKVNGFPASVNPTFGLISRR